MAKEPENIVLVMQRRKDEKPNGVDTRLDRMEFDLREVKVQPSSRDDRMSGLDGRMDRIGDRALHIQTRLDLAGPPAGFAE